MPSIAVGASKGPCEWSEEWLGPAGPMRLVAQHDQFGFLRIPQMLVVSWNKSHRLKQLVQLDNFLQ